MNNIISNILVQMASVIDMHTKMAQWFKLMQLNEYAEHHSMLALQEAMIGSFLRDYYITQFQRLPIFDFKESAFEIPKQWYEYTTEDISEYMKTSATNECIDKWRDQVEKSKAIYETAYYQLLERGEIPFANALNKLIAFVDTEIIDAVGWKTKANIVHEIAHKR